MTTIVGYVASYDEIRLLFEKPAEAIESMGAGLVYLAHSRNPMAIRTYCEIVDGIILGGGAEDVSPSWYGEIPHPNIGSIDYTRDAFEFNLLKEALEQNLPVLGICRGLHIINILAGGTLYQDLATQRANAIDHLGDWESYQKGLRGPNNHIVNLKSGSMLASIIPEGRLMVNSYHHQAVKDLATGLVASAVAEDGIIEAVEFPTYSFVLGIQWHSELAWNEDGHRELFRQFLLKANERHISNQLKDGQDTV